MAIAVFNDFVAGWTSGVAGLLVSHPLDTVKVRLQSLPSYKGALHCIVQTFKEESSRGFFKGMSAPLLMAGFLHSTFFLGYSSALTIMGVKSSAQQRREVPLHQLLSASVVGAILQWIPSCPIEIVKTRLQVQQENLRETRLGGQPRVPSRNRSQRLIFTGPIDCVYQTVRLVGVRGFYRGGLTMLARDAIGFCFYLPVYELTLRRLESQNQRRPIMAPLMAGGVAGVACWWSILPLDVIKSRLQADDLARPRYRGFLHCVRDTFRSDGLAAFARGWHVAALRGFPACACLFLVYEQTISLLVGYEQKLVAR